jgi:hypothetical protein
VAQSSEEDKWIEFLQQTRDGGFVGMPDDAPPTATAMRDTESLLQQLNSLKRWGHCVVLQYARHRTHLLSLDNLLTSLITPHKQHGSRHAALSVRYHTSLEGSPVGVVNHTRTG